MLALRTVLRVNSYSKSIKLMINVHSFRNFQSSSSLSVKMYEHQYEYDIMKKKGYVSLTNTEKTEISLYKVQFDQLLNPISQIKSHEIFEEFSAMGDVCSENNIRMSSKTFDNFIHSLTDSIKFASDNELVKLFYSLENFFLKKSLRTRNYIDVWAALYDECLKRLSSWDTDKVLKFVELFYMLNVTRRSDFCSKALKELASKTEQLSPKQLVQTLFFIGMNRKQPCDMYTLEFQFDRHFQEFNIDDLAIMSMGFFKSQTPIGNKELMSKIINKVMVNSKTIHQVSLSALVKIIRYSVKMYADDPIYQLLDTLQYEVPRLSIMTNVHIALLGTATRTLHKDCLTSIAQRVISTMSESRLKDLERLVLTYGTFCFVPQTEENFFEKVMDELRKPEREQEINEFGRCFSWCIAYLGLLNIYPEDLIKRVLSKDFLNKTFGATCHFYDREILELHNTSLIFCGDNEMNRLNEKEAAALARKYTDDVPDENFAKQYTRTEKMFLDVFRILKKNRGGGDYVIGDHILPHHQIADIIICNAPDGSPVVVTEKFNNKKFGLLRRPPDDNKWIVLVVIAGRATFLHKTDVPNGHFIAKIRELKALGYYPALTTRQQRKHSLEPLLRKLDSEVRRHGRITKRDIDEVFDELRGTHNITSSQSLLVLRCCGELVPEELPEQRTLLVQKIWSVLTERGVAMDIAHYNALLRVYLENEHPFSPAQFLEELERKGLQPNRVTYRRLMRRYCQEGDAEGATRVLEKMRELNLPVSEPAWNALVMGHAFHRDTDGAKAVLETMAGAGLEPSNRTYTLLAYGHAKKGDIDGVRNIIKTANEKDALMTDRDVLDIMEHLAVSGHGDKVEELFPFLQKSAGYNQHVCSLILRLLNKGQEETAKKIMKTMPQAANVEGTFYKGAFFIKQLLRVNKSTESLIKTCRELQTENLVPNALYIATEGALQQGHTELAQELFKELKKDGFEIRQHYFWPLFVKKGKEGDEEGLLQIVRNMVGPGLTPTGECLRDYVIPYLIGKDTEENIILKLQIANVPIIRAAVNVIVELLYAGKIDKAARIALLYQPRWQYSLMTRPLLNALVKTKDIESFASILHAISVNPTAQNEEDTSHDDARTDDNTDSNEIGRIVRAAVKNLSLDLNDKLLRAIHSKGLRISTAAAEEIEEYLGKNMTTDLSELLAHLTSPDLEAVPLESPRRGAVMRSSARLEHLIAQQKAKEGSVYGLQNQLIAAYMKEKNFDKLDSHLAELKTSGFVIKSGLLAQLFQFYCENDRLEKAMEVKNEMAAKFPDFTMNRHNIVSFARALVRAKRYDEAMKVLQDNRPDSDFDTYGFAFISKCRQMVNTLTEEKDVERVKEMTKILIDNEYMEASNVFLGPSIKVHLLMDDLDGALKEFENCCNKYRSAPWKVQLMKALIMKEDAAKLQWVVDLSTQIHGEVNVLHDLVLAYVECGRLPQARRILETPGLPPYMARRLGDACRRYAKEGKSEYLEGLLEVTKELRHIDRSNIFYHLLETYCKADETDKALGLLTSLQEEGEVASERFLQRLGNHLRSKNRPVPFVLPEQPKQKTEKANTAAQETDIFMESAVSVDIESLVKNGKATQAMDLAVESMKNGVIPETHIMIFMLNAVAGAGQVGKIQAFGQHLTEEQIKEFAFDDKLTRAVFVKVKGAEHVDKLYEAVTNAQDVQELRVALWKFPRSEALHTIINNPDMISKYHKVAEIAASKGHLRPVNLLWMEYLLNEKHTEADALYNRWLKDADSIMFSRLLQEAHIHNLPQVIEKLIDCFKSNQKASPRSVGYAYSRLIILYLTRNRTDKAEAALETALKSGLDMRYISSTSLSMLRQKVENEGKKFRYAI